VIILASPPFPRWFGRKHDFDSDQHIEFMAPWDGTHDMLDMVFNSEHSRAVSR
jgi:hypothetical protein